MRTSKEPPGQVQEEEREMRVLVLAKEGERSEAATPPTPEAMAEHEKFNGELVKAGVVVAAGRLSPSAEGKRGQFDGQKRTVIDGPFAEAKELVAGYWLWQGGPIEQGNERGKTGPRDGRALRKRPGLVPQGRVKGR